MRRTLWLWLAAAALVACARDLHAEWPHINDKLTARKLTIRKAVLLPAQIVFNRVGMKGSEGGIPESEQLSASFYSAVSKELAARGVEVLPNPSEQAKDDAATFAISDLQSRYDNIAVQVRKKPGRVAKGRYTLGDRVAKFEPAAPADSLVFIRGAGQAFTPGRKAFALATWGVVGLLFQFRGEVAVVDAKTGEVLVFIRFANNRAAPDKSEERFRQSFRNALHDVPLPMPPAKG